MPTTFMSCNNTGFGDQYRPTKATANLSNPTIDGHRRITQKYRTGIQHP